MRPSDRAASIQRLDEPIRYSLRSSLVFCSPDQIVEALVRNAFQACIQSGVSSASPGGSVWVMVDFDTWSITVKDDGHGFQRDPVSRSLCLDPGKGMETCLHLLSFNGLLQIRSMARDADTVTGPSLSQPTRHGKGMQASRTFRNCNLHDQTLILRDGKILYEGESLSSSQRVSIGTDVLSSSSLRMLNVKQGSAVMLRDLYSKLPVRRAALSSRREQRKQVERIKQSVQHLALLHPAVSFRLFVKYAEARPDTSGSRPSTSHSIDKDAQRLVLSLSKTSAILDRFRDLYGSQVVSKRKAFEFEYEAVHQIATRLAEEEATKGARKIDTSKGGEAVTLSIHGFYIGNQDDTRRAQHIFFNGERLPSSTEQRRGLGSFTEETVPFVDRYVARELERVGLNGILDPWRGQVSRTASGKNVRSKGSPCRVPSVSRSSLSSHSKEGLYGMAREAVGRQFGAGLSDSIQYPFLVMIETRRSESKSRRLDSVPMLSSNAVQRALLSALGGCANGELEPSPPTAKRRKIEQAENESTPPNVRYPSASPLRGSKTDQADGIRAINGDGFRTAKTARSDAASIQGQIPSILLGDPPIGMMAWNDPITKRTYWIDQRTGNSVDPLSDKEYLKGSSVSANESTNIGYTHPSRQTLVFDPSRRSLGLLAVPRSESQTSEAQCPSWLNDAMKKWTNPSFGSLEAAEKGGYDSDDMEIPTLNNRAIPELHRMLLLSRVESLTNHDHLTTGTKGKESRDPQGEVPIPMTPALARSQSNSPRKGAAQESDHQTDSNLSPPPKAHRTHQMTSRFFRAFGKRHGKRHRSDAGIPGRNHAVPTFEELQLSISREALQQACVIGQVDAKFIACSLPAGRGSLLVCIDQHAADERFRLERLLSEYTEGCYRGDAPVVPLSEPLDVAVPGWEEAPSLDNVHFWGFHGAELVGHGVVRVTWLPEIIRDRVLTVSGRCFQLELIEDLIKDMINVPAPPSNLGWLAASRYLPRRLMDVITSKACRSAIMFNDPLSESQCREVVSRLSECKFPFQCAHGRPSTVPLCRI